MTSQIDQLQTLIDQIDGALSKAVSRLPWAASGQLNQQRQVLRQVRDYLIGQQRSSVNFAQTTQESAALNQSAANTQQVMQSMTQEINELRSTLLRPLQSEVITLTQQRNALMREVGQLEAQIHSHALDRSYDPSALNSSQVEQLQTVHDRADQVLGTLDASLRVVFDSLQQDIDVYQASLSQGLAKLHGLGEQGEAMFTALISRLAQQLGREASAHLQSQPQALADSELPFRSTQQSVSSIGSPIAARVAPSAFDPTKISLPYPGTELPTYRAETPEPLLNDSDSIHTLTDLLEQISRGTQEPLNVISVAPSAHTETTYTPEEDLLPTHPSVQSEESQPEREEQDGSSSHSATSQSSSSAPPSVIKLAGMDDLFN